MTNTEGVTRHKTVLLNEAIEGLFAPQKAGNEKLIVVDGTFGGGGHSLEICKKNPGVKIIALDQDKGVFIKAKSKFKELGCDISFHEANFRNLDKVLGAELPFGSSAPKTVNGIILDLGLSSDQLQSSGRGFSFMRDEPLIMTMKENPTPSDVTAYEVVNTWGEESLADVIYGYGEERQARRIAGAIAKARKKQEIKTTFDLVKVIEEAIPARFRKSKIHCATKTFQAIRIAVNDELGALSEGLEKGFQTLKEGGRMSVISFHSLEDRIVKRFFKKQANEKKAILISKKPITAGKEEIKNNSRARSAKLRIIQKI
ncbi:16S rRNA (cytosine(1402)-N(4))-methyltransferase [Candidatus Nomurabacteria bacterium RIFCSPLOWO2_02_FULL_40_10]|uniref:Ribosomal RNA small subunit methyltransferase H n=2 Tax=Candidatus Nomuraibacteriota TaxID=1752729 RepID=A0A1F6XZW6_9BACT|nr:MAG: 16S rRNA (cytosine(1402)-N(4))-methyltransferase [Candidatus Nomurabacteria bacterium RIFCSPHIGHO2_01_FULL_39_10]OGI99669.1 MAG: 16S rRNA (cytosine(1402)-N(4))-methyltransferase [Candidatus Nomurabacteria bacterium RIFCSPLOWO2_02_FULL_40_10]